MTSVEPTVTPGGPRRAADLILYNANVLTLDRKRPRGELVAIVGNRILAVGDRGDLGLFRGAGTRLVDCEGGTVVPGFNDAHCHPLSFALSLTSVDCSPVNAKNVAGIQALVRRRAEETEDGEWVRATGYDEFNLEEKRPPSRWELDQAAPRHPVVLVHRTGQSCVLNSRALELVGITKQGQEQRGPRMSESDGLVSGRSDEVERAIPPVEEKELERAVRLANREWLSRGITSLQDTSWTNGWRQWQTWRGFVDRGVVSPRISMLVGTEALDDFKRRGLSTGSGDDRLRLGGVKLALDESTGSPHPPQGEIAEVALRAQAAGFQVAFHVSDVYMLEASLDAIEFVRKQADGAGGGFRLEHCAICPPPLMRRVSASRATVVTQPSFLYCFGERYRDDLAADQVEWLYPNRSFRRLGIEVALGSDSPLVGLNPLLGIHAAVTRETEAGRKLAPTEGVRALEALRMYTLAGAEASNEGARKGVIRAGMLADLAVLGDDPTRLAPAELRDLTVVRTIVDGEIVWEE